MNQFSPATARPSPAETANAMVYLVDDDEAVRDSLGWLLEGNGFSVRTFPSAEAFLTAFDPTTISCVVLDVRMDGMSGIELHDELLRRGWDVPLIFITGHGDVGMAVSRMKRGAIEFLEKPFGDRQFCNVVAAGLQAARERFKNRQRQDADRNLLARLTPRERQVLDLIVAGRLNKQIADDLSISIKTVEAHRANVMDKFEVRTMADLMRRVLGAYESDKASGTASPNQTPAQQQTPSRH